MLSECLMDVDSVEMDELRRPVEGGGTKSLSDRGTGSRSRRWPIAVKTLAPIEGRPGKNELLPASSTWAKFNVVPTAGPTGEEDQFAD
jgi:hypothetical protein